MSKKLSIAIPTYNRLGYLKECLASILGQSFQDFSVYVFDNASDEPVEQELQKYQDERIHFIGNEKNVGFQGNMNRILNYPFESEYLVIFHDDDAMHPKMLELEIAFLDTHKEVIFVVSDLHRVSDKTIHSYPSFAEDKIEYVVYKNSYEFARAEMSWLSASFDSAMYRVKALEGEWIKSDQFFHFDDMVLLVEISKKGPCAFIAAPLI
jgi:glycosyltransferase involved in cell wall biosynthesis